MTGKKNAESYSAIKTTGIVPTDGDVVAVGVFSNNHKS